MQTQLAKRQRNDPRQALPHQSLSGKGLHGVIAKIGTLKAAPNDLIQINYAGQPPGLPRPHQEAALPISIGAVQIIAELRGRRRRTDPSAMQMPAKAHGLKEWFFIPRPRRLQDHASAHSVSLQA